MNDYLLHRLNLKLGLKTNLVKEANKIPIKSVKRIVEEKLYKKIVKEMLAENPNCEIKETGCQVKATGLHHITKRSPKNYTDRNNLKRACNNCQLWVELNPIEAIEKRHSKSKYL